MFKLDHYRSLTFLCDSNQVDIYQNVILWIFNPTLKSIAEQEQQQLLDFARSSQISYWEVAALFFTLTVFKIS